MNRAVAVLGLTTGLFASSWANSADVPKVDKYDVHAACSGPSQVLSGVKDHIGGTYQAICTPDGSAGTFWNNVIGFCEGVWSMASGNYQEHGVCEFTDSTGDKFFGRYVKDGNADGKWQVTGGTGKYEGMEQGGLFNIATQKPTLQGQLGAVFHWWGNYKMR
jgi:hypothetical protein